MRVPEPVCFISHFRVKEGRLEFLRQLAHETATQLLAEKPRTALFLSFADAERGVISFVHAFADAEAMDLHFVGAGDRARTSVEHMEPLGWEVYGKPSESAMGALRQAAAAAGVSLTTEPEYLAGFLRLGSR